MGNAPSALTTDVLAKLLIQTPASGLPARGTSVAVECVEWCPKVPYVSECLPGLRSCYDTKICRYWQCVFLRHRCRTMSGVSISMDLSGQPGTSY